MNVIRFLKLNTKTNYEFASVSLTDVNGVKKIKAAYKTKTKHLILHFYQPMKNASIWFFIAFKQTEINPLLR